MNALKGSIADILSRKWWVLLLRGALAIAFGILTWTRPGAGALAVLWIIGAYAVIFGLIVVVLAFKARSFGKRLAAA